MVLNFHFTHKEKTNRAILLFHGMTGSPYELKKFGQFLYKEGFDVFADCIPGHGKDFQNILKVTYKDWEFFAHKSFETLALRYDKVYVGGLCLGALLALSVAEKYPQVVNGILSLSTTLYLDGSRMPWYKCLLPIGLFTITRFFYTYPEGEPYGIKNEKTRHLIKKLLEQNNVGMDNYPMSCIYELCRLSKRVQNDLKKVTAPILIIHSIQDDLTSTKSAYKVFRGISSDNKKLVLLKDSYHMILYDNDRDYVFDLCKTFLFENLNDTKRSIC